jgi:8-oxo-dGTP pyrophosphatase MutT (NUDIX family)
LAGEKPQDAATVILLRDRPEGACEIFLMRRGSDQSFMGGAHVFPGGRLDAADRDPELAAFTGGLSPSQARRLLQQEDLPETAALGIFMAAIRETFEEAGILLARDRRSEVVDLSDRGTVERFAAYRLALHDRRLTLAQLARREGLLYAPDLLIPYARWITPEIEYQRRFDARFFLAKLPEGQLAAHDRMELTDSRWMTAAAALEDHAAGRIVLMPPTLKTVEELLPFSACGPLLAAAAPGRIEAILPEAFRTADGFGFRLPQDSEYTLTGRRKPQHPGETTRVVMEGGIWRSRSK